jgi:hypothetical protein
LILTLSFVYFSGCQLFSFKFLPLHANSSEGT